MKGKRMDILLQCDAMMSSVLAMRAELYGCSPAKLVAACIHYTLANVGADDNIDRTIMRIIEGERKQAEKEANQ